MQEGNSTGKQYFRNFKVGELSIADETDITRLKSPTLMVVQSNDSLD